MKIAVVHNLVGSRDAPDARDVLVQAEAVSQALIALGHQPFSLACSLDLAAITRQLGQERPDLVFNLVEDLGGHGRLIHFFPALLDALRIAYTGSAAEIIYLSSHKTQAKECMARNHLPTPAWRGADSRLRQQAEADVPLSAGRWIIKSLWEHASLGLDSGSVISTGSPQVLDREMIGRRAALGGACFAEEFIPGREFNLSLLASDHGVDLLPPAEIIFKDYPPEMLQIVDYQAKWQEDSFAYSNTVRSFEFDSGDGALIRELQELARKCWQVFGLQGYARVDFRVDPAGRPFILEVNANPCLSPDAGFAAALQRAGIGFEEAVNRIIAAAQRSLPQ